jgi:hypothetical protein
MRQFLIICLFASPALILALAIFHRVNPASRNGSFPTPSAAASQPPASVIQQGVADP